jgi:hypothetical protein
MTAPDDEIIKNLSEPRPPANRPVLDPD